MIHHVVVPKLFSLLLFPISILNFKWHGARSKRRRDTFYLSFLLAPLALLLSCAAPEPPATVEPIPTNTLVVLAAVDTPTPFPTQLSPATLTPIPTITPSPTNTPTQTPIFTPTPSPTPTKSACVDRIPPQDDLLVIVSQEFGLSRDYEPKDLVPIGPHFSRDITLGYPTMVREEVLDPLINMVNAMLDVGLDPYIISGYRSYATQAATYNKWLNLEPDRVDTLSAKPGHSEHQLGTTVDFGSYRLHEYIDESFDDDLQFHTYFFKTPEGDWLQNNAHRYGFTLSYPRSAQEVTGFYYEPWHFRYVGVGNATALLEGGTSLTEYLLNQDPEPCFN